MKKYFWFLLLLSCDDFDVSSELLPYFKDFEIEAKSRGIRLDYKSVDIQFQRDLVETKGFLAYGQALFSGDKKIVIDTDFWETADDSYRELVLYHEFGHSFLCRKHEYIGLSIMRTPVLQDEWTFKRNEMLDELFNNRTCD